MSNIEQLSREDLLLKIKSYEDVIEKQKDLIKIQNTTKKLANPLIQKRKALRKVRELTNIINNTKINNDVIESASNLNDLDKEFNIEDYKHLIAEDRFNGNDNINSKNNNKFKNLIGGFITKLDKSYQYINSSDFNFYNIGYKVGFVVKNLELNDKIESYHLRISKPLNKLSEFKNNFSENTALLVKGAIGIKNSFFLFGQKRTVLKARKELTETMRLIGFNLEDLKFNKSIDKISLKSQDELSQLFSEKMKHLDIEYKNSAEITLSILDKIDDKVKVNVIEKMIWPNLKQGLINVFNIIHISNEIQSNDPYMKKVEIVARNNNVSFDSIAIALKNNDNLIKTLIGGKNLLINKKEILNSCDKYAYFLSNTLELGKAYYSITEKMLLTLPDELKDHLMNKDLFSINGKNTNLTSISNLLFSVEKIDSYNEPSEKLNIEQKRANLNLNLEKESNIEISKLPKLST